MIDKADAIVKRQMKRKLSYYISPLWIKLAIMLLIGLIVLLNLYG